MPKKIDKKTIKAELDFIDAALELHRASLSLKRKGVSVDASGPVAGWHTPDLTAAIVSVTVYAYHTYHSRAMGADKGLMKNVDELKLTPNASLAKLVEARKNLAKKLGK